MSASDRTDLYERLAKLLPAQWEDLLFRLNVSREYLPSPLVAPATQASELIRLLEQSADGLARLAVVIERFKSQPSAAQSASAGTQHAYEFDLFVSYWRKGDWPKWVCKKFMPLFSHWITTELGFEPKIAVDYERENEGSWPIAHARNLARSRVMVGLFSSAYFTSNWCLSELALMRRREDLCRPNPSADRRCLIVAARIHDGDSYPRPIMHFAMKDLSNYVNMRVAHGSRTAELLDTSIKEWVHEIARAIDYAPPIDPAWESLTADSALDEYRRPPLPPRPPTW